MPQQGGQSAGSGRSGNLSETTKLVSRPGEVLTCVLLHLTEICSGPALSVDGLQKLEGAWGPPRRKLCRQVWVVRRRAIGCSYTWAAEGEGGRKAAQGQPPKAPQGQARSSVPCLLSTLSQGRTLTGREAGEGWGSLQSWHLFHFPPSFLPPHTCLFLLRTSQLPHPSVQLQDQLQLTWQPSTSSYKAGQGAWGTHQSHLNAHLQGETLLERLNGRNHPTGLSFPIAGKKGRGVSF